MEGNRQITREMPFYNMDMMNPLGCRVKSLIAMQFRRWATFFVCDISGWELYKKQEVEMVSMQGALWMNMMKEEFCKKIHTILGQLTYANSSIHIISSIDKFISEGDNIDILVPDINFWKVILDNCGYRIYAELAKVYDEHPQAMGLKCLMDFCEQNQSIFLDPECAPMVLKQLRQQYDAVSDLRAKLKAIRDQGLFHLDRKYALNLCMLLKQETICFDEQTALLHTAAEICNTILEYITGERRSIEVLLNDDARHILEDLKCLKRKKDGTGTVIRSNIVSDL